MAVQLLAVQLTIDMIIPYIVGMAVYISSVLVSYSTSLKQTNWYFPIGLSLAIVANTMWLYIAKHSSVKDDLYVRGLVWDAMIVSAYVIVPLIWYGVRPTGYTLAGCIFIVIGLILTKLG